MFCVKGFTSNRLSVRLLAQYKTRPELRILTIQFKLVCQKCPSRYKGFMKIHIGRDDSLEIFKKIANAILFPSHSSLLHLSKWQVYKGSCPAKNLRTILDSCLPNFKSISESTHLYLQSVFRIQPLHTICFTPLPSKPSIFASPFQNSTLFYLNTAALAAC